MHEGTIDGAAMLASIVALRPSGLIDREIVHQHNGRLEEASVTIDFGERIWTLNRADGAVFRHASGRTSTPELVFEQREWEENLPSLGMQLMFATSLPMWGRRTDNYFPEAQEVQSDGTIILFRHRDDPLLRAAAFLSSSENLLTRLVTPADYVEVRTLGSTK